MMQKGEGELPSDNQLQGSHKRIFVATEDFFAMEGLKGLLSEKGFLISEFFRGVDLLKDLDRQNPMCVLFDADLKDVGPVLLMEFISRRRPMSPVIFFGSNPPTAMVVRLLKMGAIDFQSKPIRHRDVFESLQEARNRHQSAWNDAEDFQRLGESYKQMTSREQEVFTLVARGLLNKQIAHALGITEKTVKVHRGRVMRKLGIRSVAELVRVADKLAAFRKVFPPIILPVCKTNRIVEQFPLPHASSSLHDAL